MLAPKLWNALPEKIGLADSVTSFKSLLKSHLYRKAFKEFNKFKCYFLCFLPGTLFIDGIFGFIMVKKKKPVIQLFLDIHFCLVVLLSFFLFVKHFVALFRKAMHK